MSGPKLIYRIKNDADDKHYIVITDEARDLLVSVMDEETKEAVYRDEITERGIEIMDNIRACGISFGFEKDSAE